MPPQQPNDPDQTNQYQANVPPSGPPNTPKPSRRTKALLAGLVALVLLGAALWLFATDREEMSQTGDPAQDSGMVISITNDGFSPGTVLITPGTTVTWTNDSDGPAHIASNPHPEHDGLSGFDSAEPIFIGDSYTFTFEEPGTYGYHDHLNPETNGTVEVTETEEGSE